jgi:urease accessory protein
MASGESPSAHGDGLIHLRFSVDRSRRTFLAQRRARFPLRTTVPFHLDPADPSIAFCYVQNPTGGVFAGDRLVQSIILDAGARAHVTTQSATKLCDMDGGEARQDITIELGDGACLELIPDPIIPQAGSSFAQRTLVRVGRGSMLLASEIVHPGRRAFGERYGFERLSLSLSVEGPSGLLCADTLRLEPNRRSPRQRGVCGDREYLCSFFVIAPEHPGEALASRLEGPLFADHEWAAAGVLPNGAGAHARILARSALDVSRAQLAVWEAARRETLGLPLPPRRK